MVMGEIEREVEAHDAGNRPAPFDHWERETLVEYAAAYIRSIEAIDRR